MIDGKVYCGGYAIAGVDPATFRTLSSNCKKHYAYAVDAHRVYLNGRPVDAADPSTFSCIEGTSYGRDANRAYKSGHTIPESDGATFEVIPNVPGCENFSRDAHHVYFDVILLDLKQAMSVR